MNCIHFSRTHTLTALLAAVIALGVLSSQTLSTIGSERSTRSLTEIDRSRKADLQQAVSKLPLLFEANHGQADQATRFIARANGADAFLQATSVVFVLRSDAPFSQRKIGAGHGHLVNTRQAVSPSFTMQVRGGNSHAVAAGNYDRVQFSNVYPGIDLVYYGNQRQLEYDFIVAPGANPKAIRLGFSGIEFLQLDEHGDLLVRLAGRQVIQRRPRLYQNVEGKKTEVSGEYALLDNKEVAFHVGRYDKSRALVIDPAVETATPPQPIRINSITTYKSKETHHEER